MASGVPVVATAVGSIPEMLDSGVEGILVETGDVEALGEALLALKRDPRQRAEMGRRARERALARYTQQEMVKRYAELFDSLSDAQRKDT